MPRTPYRTFTASNGVTFAVRYLPEGARYGLSGTLIAEAPTAEFYDTRWADDVPARRDGGGFGPMGQFVSRYYAATLLGTELYGNGTGALRLDTGSPLWAVDAATMGEIRAWLATL